MNAFSRYRLQFVVVALCILLCAGVAAARPFWAQVPKINETTQNLDWEIITAEISSAPAVTASAVAINAPEAPVTNEINVFYRDQTKCVRHLLGTDRGKDLAQISSLPPPCDDDMDGDMSAIAWDNSGRIDIFWFRGFTGSKALMHRWIAGGKWYKETVATTATSPASAPAVASWGNGHLDVFWRDTNNNIRWLGFDRSKKGKFGYTKHGWFKTERVAATDATGSPAAVERATNLIGLFWRDTNGTLMHRYTNDGGSTWSGNKSLGVTASTAPSATSWGKKRVDVVYGVDANHLGHLWIDGSTGSWEPNHETLYSRMTIGTPVAVAAPRHPGRLDVFTREIGGRIIHTLSQESLPGFTGVGEGSNGGAGDWCSEAAAASVINYVTNPNPPVRACDAANKRYNMTTCCQVPTAPAVCSPEGGTNVAIILNRYHISYDKKQLLPLKLLRKKLWQEQQAIISRHAHPIGGHYVVIIDTYRLHGEDIVVLSDPKFNTTGDYWAIQYSEYLKNHYGTDENGQPNGWKAVYMFTNFAK